MGAEAKAKAEAVVLAALVLMSCFAASSSYCIPRRLLVALRREPCNDDLIDRPTPRGDGRGEAAGLRKPEAPPPPTGGRSRAASVPTTAAPPRSNN